MPSQSIHIPEDDYEYGITTRGEDQSTSARFAELVAKGRQYEEAVEVDGALLELVEANKRERLFEDMEDIRARTDDDEYVPLEELMDDG